MIQLRPFHTLLCIFLVHADFINSQNVCNQPINVTFLEVYLQQPYYILLTSGNSSYTKFDSRCYTYTPLPKTKEAVLGYDASVSDDRSLKVMPCIVSDGGPGVVGASSPACYYTDTTIAQVPECGVDLILRNFIYGDCTLEGTVKGEDFVYGLSCICKPLNRTCQCKVLSVLNDCGYGNLTYNFAPMKLPPKCVIGQPSVSCANKLY